MGFSTHTEQQALRALTAALEPRFRVYEKVRVIDCLSATAAHLCVSDPVGPTLGTWLLPAMRALAGPFDRNHPWLQSGDWTYALKSHFDFVVHADMDSSTPSHPLFAVEFDGDSHGRPEVQRRDRRRTGCVPLRGCRSSASTGDSSRGASGSSSCSGSPKRGPPTGTRCRGSWPNATPRSTRCPTMSSLPTVTSSCWNALTWTSS